MKVLKFDLGREKRGKKIRFDCDVLVQGMLRPCSLHCCPLILLILSSSSRRLSKLCFVLLFPNPAFFYAEVGEFILTLSLAYVTLCPVTFQGI